MQPRCNELEKMLARGVQEEQQQGEEGRWTKQKNHWLFYKRLQFICRRSRGMILSECGRGHLTIELQQGDWCEKCVWRSSTRWAGLPKTVVAP